MRNLLLKTIGPRGAWVFFDESSPKSTNKEIAEHANFLARKRLGYIAAMIRQKPNKFFLLWPLLTYRYLQLVQVNILTKNFPD